jgi:membrane protein YqaA with SNARE-associated domain
MRCGCRTAPSASLSCVRFPRSDEFIAKSDGGFAQPDERDRRPAGEALLNGILRSVAIFFFSLGGFGLLLLGVLDSSFLFMPLGNDLLVVALTAAHRERMLYYVVMATIGSVLGVAFTHWVSAKGGQKGIEGDHKSKRIEYIERKVREQGGIAIATAALMPPPFPFTPFIIVAGALQYPRRKMLLIIAASRGLRFAIEGSLALIYGRRIIGMAQQPYVQDFILALVVISMAGSAWSIYSWVKKSRTRAG